MPWRGTSFQALGGAREDLFRVTNPKVQVSAAVMNDITTNVGGASITRPCVSLTIDENGEKVAGGEAWNDADDASKRVDITHEATGEYTIRAQAAEYADWSDTAYPVTFSGAVVTPQSDAPIVATYKILEAASLVVYLFDPADSWAPVDCAFTVDIK